MQRAQNSLDRRNEGHVVADMVKGAVAGAIGVWALDQVTWFMWNREDPEVLAQERQARPGGLDPAHVTADRVSQALGVQLMPKQPNPPGIAVHYSLGVVPGALYGVLRHTVPGLGLGRGALFGLGLFLLQDELLNSLLGTSGAPTDYPWQAHARGVVGHVVYGIVTDTMCDVLDQIT